MQFLRPLQLQGNTPSTPCPHTNNHRATHFSLSDYLTFSSKLVCRTGVPGNGEKFSRQPNRNLTPLFDIMKSIVSTFIAACIVAPIAFGGDCGTGAKKESTGKEVKEATLLTGDKKKKEKDEETEEETLLAGDKKKKKEKEEEKEEETLLAGDKKKKKEKEEEKEEETLLAGDHKKKKEKEEEKEEGTVLA